MYPIALVSVVVVAAVWGFVYRLRVSHPLDPLAILMYSILLRFLIRPAALAVGIDGPHPDYLFAPSATEQYIILGELYTALFLIGLAFGAGLPPGLTDLTGPLFPRISRDVSMYRALGVAFLFTLVSVITYRWLNREFGELKDMIVALKVDKETAGVALVRNCGVLGAFLSVGVVLRLIQKRWHGERSISPIFIPIGLAMAGFNGFFLFACGSRSTLVFSVLCLAFGLTTYRRNRISWVKLGGLAVLAVGFAIVLRFMRDHLVWGHVSEVVEGETPVRQMFVMANMTYFDAFMLIIRDWSNKLHYGEDFLNGMYASIPRAFWPNKPLYLETPGSALRYAYEGHRNGWPPGAIGEWYWNFGLVGVAAGGVLSGLIFRVMQVRYGDFIRNPFSLTLIVFFVTKMFETGIISQTFVNYAMSFPFLLIISLLLYSGDRSEQEAHEEVDGEAFMSDDFVGAPSPGQATSGY